MIKPFLYIVFLVSFASTAQNLVPNGSFEEYTDCPIENELGNNGQFERCKNWWTPINIGTADYYNSCNNSLGGVVGVPNNFQGFQSAFEGDAYVGLGAFEYSLYTNEVFAVELIETKLCEMLVSCREYKFSMWVNLGNYATHGISRLGVFFSKDSVHFNTMDEWESINPSWVNSFPLTDTNQWKLLEFDYIADGGERFLTIGYFGDYDYSELVFNDSTAINTFNTYFPYYYIDSISLLEIGELESCTPEFPNVFTPNNDQKNDYFSIEGIAVEQFVILNRWGQVVAILTKDNPEWDGTFEGKPCSEGSYFYRTNFGSKILTGFIELIR